MKIIIADDEMHIRKRLEEKIDWKALGLEQPVFLDDGDLIAERFWAGERADILMTDIRMPRMDGISAARKAREMEPDLELILMSAYDDKDYLKSALDLHVAGYLEKPFSIEQAELLLKRAVRSCENREELKREEERKKDHIMESLSEDQKQMLEKKPDIRTILSYIEEHLKDPDLSLKEISEAHYMSVTNLCVFFKEKTGKTIRNSIIESRMKKAAELLLYTDLKVAEIAAETGFSDQGYFTKSFTRFYGKSPSKYKETHHKELHI